MAPRRFDALFIDFYGTVTGGDRQAVEETSRRVVEDLALPMSAGDFAVAWGKKFFAAADAQDHGPFRNLVQIEEDTLRETLEDMGIHGADPVRYVAQLKSYWANPALQPEAAEALAALDIPICCVSNADTEDILSAIERHHLRFDHVVTSEDAECYKPAPAIFEQALRAVDLPPERVVHAGDSLHADVSGAAPLGITTVWVCRQGRIFDVGTAKPDYNISSLNGLADIIG